MQSSTAIRNDLGTAFPLELLLADDNLVNRKVGEGLLARLGYTVDLATNGKEAMEMLRCKGYDVLFLDLQMPLMDGFEVTEALRKEFQKNTRPVIVAMTGSAGSDDKAECLRAGMDDHMSKPVRLEDLQALLIKWAKALPGRRAAG